MSNSRHRNKAYQDQQWSEAQDWIEESNEAHVALLCHRCSEGSPAEFREYLRGNDNVTDAVQRLTLLALQETSGRILDRREEKT